jgi:hypothetical protein
MANVVVSAIATFNGKALKKGQKELSAFDKQAQQLGKTFNRVFATTAIVAFSKKAINAFAADEKAAKSLAVQLENTGNAFRVNEVESYIANLQKLYGVLDDQLRPAFQTLLNATGSVTLSQKALETALNVSAGTGKDLESVVAAIAKSATGTTTALARLGTGLDKATIASGDMNKIMAALDKKFAGQAQARLSTYSGKMDLLKVAAADATEIIGKGLIDALTAIGKDNSIDQATNSMNSFATAIANTATGMGQLIGEIKKVIDSDVGKFLLGIAALLTLGKKQLVLGAAGLIAYDIGKGSGTTNPSTARVKDYTITTKLFKARNEEYKIITASNKAKLEVDKLKEKFDLERIGLTAALNAATDEETKLRIRAQLAILDNNEVLAKKLLAEMNAAEAAKALADAAKKATDPLGAFGRAVSEMAATLNMQNKALQDEKMGKSSYVTSAPSAGTTYAPFTGSVDELPGTLNFINKAQQDEKIGKNSYVINIDASNMIDANNMNQVVQQALLSIQKEGGSTTYAGSL